MKTRFERRTRVAVVFEPEFVALLKTLFEELIVFNHTLGLQITEILARARHGAARRCGPS